MSQYILIGSGETSYNTTTTPITLPDNYLLFASNGVIAGMAPPTYSNNILQYDTNVNSYVWNELTFSTITGNNETTQGILWNDINDSINTLSASDGIYQIKIDNNSYSLCIASDGNLSFDSEDIPPYSILINDIIPNTITYIEQPSNNGYLYCDSNGYSWVSTIKIISDEGLLYWNGSSYENINIIEDGIYAFNNSISSVTNITKDDGFLIASNNNIISLNYPTSSGDYYLNISSSTNSLSWKLKQITTDTYSSININTALSNNDIIYTFTNNGKYNLTFNFIAYIDIYNLPAPEMSFDDFLLKCPTLNIIDTNDNILLSKIFTGPLSYDYFSLTTVNDFTIDDSMIVKWLNNDDNIVTITTTDIIINYIESDASNYQIINDSNTGVLYTFDESKKILVNINIEYQLDIINTPSDSEITITIGSINISIKAIPPLSVQYINISRIVSVNIHDTLTLNTNNVFINIISCNIVINTLETQ